MKYSKATNYALHVVQRLYREDNQASMSVTAIAEAIHVAPSYLSKILTNLVKANILEAVSGTNGGYCINKQRDAITMLDVIHAIEGKQSMFTCAPEHGPNCLIYQKMQESEVQMESFLANIKISDLI